MGLDPSPVRARDETVDRILGDRGEGWSMFGDMPGDCFGKLIVHEPFGHFCV